LKAIFKPKNKSGDPMDRPIFTLYDFETIDFTALLLCFLQKQQFEYTTQL